MATIQININNLATTHRPDEFKGTIALDHHTHGQLLDNFLNEHIGSYIQNGYSFVGGKLNLRDSVKVTENDEVDMTFIMSLNESENLYSASRTVSFSQFLLCFTENYISVYRSFGFRG